MNSALYTETKFAELKAMPKRVTNPSARWQDKPKAAPTHRQRNLQVVSAEDPDVRFAIYQRQNINAAADFSCGIRYCPLGGTPIVLVRYNGPSHIHHDIAYPHTSTKPPRRRYWRAGGRSPPRGRPTGTRRLKVPPHACWRTTTSPA